MKNLFKENEKHGGICSSFQETVFSLPHPHTSSITLSNNRRGHFFLNIHNNIRNQICVRHKSRGNVLRVVRASKIRVSPCDHESLPTPLLTIREPPSVQALFAPSRAHERSQNLASAPSPVCLQTGATRRGEVRRRLRLEEEESPRRVGCVQEPSGRHIWSVRPHGSARCVSFIAKYRVDARRVHARWKTRRGDLSRF